MPRSITQARHMEIEKTRAFLKVSVMDESPRPPFSFAQISFQCEDESLSTVDEFWWCGEEVSVHSTSSANSETREVPASAIGHDDSKTSPGLTRPVKEL